MSDFETLSYGGIPTPFFFVSLNPPEYGSVGDSVFEDAVDRIEKKLGHGQMLARFKIFHTCRG